jgi:hypothetical protein
LDGSALTSAFFTLLAYYIRNTTTRPQSRSEFVVSCGVRRCEMQYPFPRPEYGPSSSQGVCGLTKPQNRVQGQSAVHMTQPDTQGYWRGSFQIAHFCFPCIPLCNLRDFGVTAEIMESWRVRSLSTFFGQLSENCKFLVRAFVLSILYACDGAKYFLQPPSFLTSLVTKFYYPRLPSPLDSSNWFQGFASSLSATGMR